jgi:hypothetical protein
MSCDVAVSAALLFASFHPQPGTAPMLIPAVATAEATNPIAKEPLFAGIIGQARALQKDVEAFRAEAKAAKPLSKLDRFEKKVTALSEADMKGHLELASRGTDGDLKCILRGISQDLPKKLDELMKAATPATQEVALRDMAYLLVDNVEVITSPAAPEV